MINIYNILPKFCQKLCFCLIFLYQSTLHENLFAQIVISPIISPNDTINNLILQKYINQKVDSLLKIKIDSIIQSKTKQETAPKSPPHAFQYRILGDGFTMEGNANRILMTYRTELAYTKNRFQMESNPRFVYGEQNTNLAERDFFSDLSINFYKNQILYGFGLGTYEFSNLRGIANRYLGGVGVGWRIYNNHNLQFSLTNAFIYESTDFIRRTDFATWRNSTRIKLKYGILQQRIKFAHYIFFQPSIQDINNVRWNINFLAEMPLYKGFSCRLSIDDFYESIVFDNRKQNDLTFRFGFLWGNK